MPHNHCGGPLVTFRFKQLQSVPGVTGYGAWDEYSWDNEGTTQHGAILIPDHAPWRDLFVWLDHKGETLPDTAASVEEEAHAIVAACWHYGSYIHPLTAGEYFPDFHRDRRRSRLSDGEMHRINLEFSSGLADWFATERTDRGKINRRIRAAHQSLPMPWAKDARVSLSTGQRDEETNPILSAFLKRVEGAERTWLGSRQPSELVPVEEELALRLEANFIVNQAYRNGAIEDFHAGHWSLGCEVPGFIRLNPEEMRRLARTTASSIQPYLEMYRGRRDPRSPALLFASKTLVHWSTTEETTAVRYPGIPDGAPMTDRLTLLGARYPLVYGRRVTRESSEIELR